MAVGKLSDGKYKSSGFDKLNKKSTSDDRAKVETALLGCVSEIDKKNTEVVKELKKVAALKPPVESVSKRLKIQTNISENIRKKEIDDLKKSGKRKELNSNPTKIKRIIDSINDDIKACEKLADDHPKEVDKVFEGELDTLEKQLTAKIPAGVHPGNVRLGDLVKAFKAKQKKLRWKDFKGERLKFIQQVKVVFQNAENESKINAFARDNEMLKLNYKVRTKIIEKGLKEKSSPSTVESALVAALIAQSKPSKSQWVQHFGMTGYTVTGVTGSYDSYGIHITFDQNSWSPDTDGGISVTKMSAKDILEKMLNISDWTYQLHATLELKDNKGRQAHVYYGGKDNHWDTVAADNGKTAKMPKWKTDGIAALKKVLAALKARMLKQIQVAIDKHGDI